MVVGRGEGEEGHGQQMMRKALVLAAIVALSAPAGAESRHGLSAFGDLKYPADFRHFEYVNPKAPKGGRIATIGTLALQTFDSFNGYILKGDAAQGIGLLFDSLMTRAYDEPDAVYGLIARTADLAQDRMSVTFELRPEARFSDGTPLTADDVCETFRLLKESGHPNIQNAIRDVTACKINAPTSVTYRFTGTNIRDLPLEVAVLPVFSKAYYATRDFAKTTLEPPLGSGPYKVGRFAQGQYVSYERREDYWAKDMPVTRGRNNFGEIRYEYFRDRTPEVEALKSGLLDLREEFTSRDWATAYEGLRSIAERRLIKEVLPDELPSGAQGFFLNMRRPAFADIKVRQALGLAFDFEWSNANLFYGLYKRSESVFENTPLKATGEPSAAELTLLEEVKGDLKPGAIGPAIQPPKSDGSGRDRKLLGAASKLLDEAGWKRDGSVRKNAKGEVLQLEILDDSPSFERVFNPYVANLRLIGVDATVRIIDQAQYQRRIEAYDFDMVPARYVTDLTPGSGLRQLFGSEAADAPGTYNLAGIKSKAVDRLIEAVTQAKSREDMTVAAKALDRALRAEYFWVPNWYKGSHTIVYWDIFGRPAIKPRYDRGILDTWWIDSDKAAKLKRGN
jgi:microcin C transport system substrate-binding protein